MFAPNSNLIILPSHPNQENLPTSLKEMNEAGSNIELTQPKEKNMKPQPVTHIEAKLIDNCCRGGEHQIKVNALDSEKLLEIMDYWWKNDGL